MESQKRFEGKHSDLTGKILGAFFQIHKEMGLDFLRRCTNQHWRFCYKKLNWCPHDKRKYWFIIMAG